MDAGGLAQMPPSGFVPSNGLGMPTSGLASRRGGQNIKPLSFEALKSPSDKDNGVPTPRTSRSHLLAGLRTAPKSATAATFPNNPASPTTTHPSQMRAGNSASNAMYNGSLYNGPKTSLPRYGTSQPQGYHAMTGYGQHFTADQILAPPEIHLDEQCPEQLDPNLYAQLLATNVYLVQQRQRLQQQLMNVQAAANQLGGLNLGNAQQMQQAYQSLYQQQQAQQIMTPGMAQPNIYALYDPATGQQTYYVDQNTTQLNPQLVDQQQFNASGFGMYQPPQQSAGAPRVQVSPPPAEPSQPSFRNSSPPQRFGSPNDQHAPLPPPSANAFRRGHKKSSSLANANSGALSVGTQEPPKSAGPKTACFPLTPLTGTGGYGPGQGRAGEHPVRQPRGPPSFDELSSKPTAKHEGSKNFVTRTRRSAVHNLVRAGMERRKGTGSSGSISPIDESTEEAETVLTDNDSDSGRSGSGSLVGDNDAESSLPSSRTSTGSWGAIGSDRPSSRQKARSSEDGTASDSDRENSSSFASVFKNGTAKAKVEGAEVQRKAPMLVLTSAEKRKGGAVFAA